MISTKIKIILKILFLKFNNINILFGEKILIYKFYISKKTLPIIKQIQIIKKINFVIAALNINKEIFIVYITI